MKKQMRYQEWSDIESEGSGKTDLAGLLSKLDFTKQCTGGHGKMFRTLTKV